MAFPSKTHSLSWSHTRMTVLDRCERKYYLNYYDGDLKKKDPELWRENSVLKRIKSLEMWMGEKSHFLLSDYLHLFQNFFNEWKVNPGLREEQINTLKEKMKSEMEEEFNYSKTLDFNDYDQFFERKIGLTEHYYGENVDDQLPVVVEKVLGNLDRFMNSDWNSKILSYFENGKEIFVETPRVAQFSGMKVNVDLIKGLENISVLAVPDFWVVFSDVDFLILDWKSGKEDVLQSWIPDQLKLYALKKLLKMRRTDISWIRIEVYEVYLNSMNKYGGIVTQQDIDDIIAKIQKDVEKQKDFLKDRDPIKNIPLDPEYFHDALSEKKCASCTFRSVCKKIFK